MVKVGFYYFQYIPNYNALLESGLTSESIKQMLTNNEVIAGVSQSQLGMLKSIFPAYNASMVVASGCILGIMAAFGMMNPEAKLMLIFLPIPIN